MIIKPATGLRRVSTSEQDESGLGVAAQEAAIRVFAAAEGFELVEVCQKSQGASWASKNPPASALLLLKRRN